VCDTVRNDPRLAASDSEGITFSSWPLGTPQIVEHPWELAPGMGSASHRAGVPGRSAGVRLVAINQCGAEYCGLSEATWDIVSLFMEYCHGIACFGSASDNLTLRSPFHDLMNSHLSCLPERAIWWNGIDLLVEFSSNSLPDH
jgi:hypothetical protein